jgi:hypothetical protein
LGNKTFNTYKEGEKINQKCRAADNKVPQNFSGYFMGMRQPYQRVKDKLKGNKTAESMRGRLGGGGGAKLKNEKKTNNRTEKISC